jgi:hypothetical protein
LIRDPDLRPSRESWEEVRLVREFAHHVDGILVFLQDVLMPRKLEAHLDDDFQAVREALLRRVGWESRAPAATGAQALTPLAPAGL